MILELHLVDPNRRIMSTAMVPPQQREWWARAVRRRSPRLWRLPLEIWNKIVEMVEDKHLLDDGEGRLIRDAFVKEREGFQRRHTKAMMEYLEWELDPDGE